MIPENILNGYKKIFTLKGIEFTPDDLKMFVNLKLDQNKECSDGSIEYSGMWMYNAGYVKGFTDRHGNMNIFEFTDKFFKEFYSEI